MATEIERKFLVLNDDWRPAIDRVLHLTDGLVVANEQRKVRVRVCGEQAMVTIKARQMPGVNAEFEYPIPLKDAEELLANHCDGNVLSKHRYFVPYEGHTWQVDEYEGVLAGVVMAEVELPSIDSSLVLPPWIGKEVTGDPKYRKINLYRARLKQCA